MEEVFSGFYKLFQDTKEGKLGKTAQFLTRYINFMHLYHDFTRSIRIGDVEVFTSCLPKLANIFFALNHPNYARWLVKYYDSILKLNETHPEVYNDFKQGWFAIRRTEKLFSSIAIDLILEQTKQKRLASTLEYYPSLILFQQGSIGHNCIISAQALYLGLFLNSSTYKRQIFFLEYIWFFLISY